MNLLCLLGKHKFKQILDESIRWFVPVLECQKCKRIFHGKNECFLYIGKPYFQYGPTIILKEKL